MVHDHRHDQHWHDAPCLNWRGAVADLGSCGAGARRGRCFPLLWALADRLMCHRTHHHALTDLFHINQRYRGRPAAHRIAVRSSAGSKRSGQEQGALGASTDRGVEGVRVCTVGQQETYGGGWGGIGGLTYLLMVCRIGRMPRSIAWMVGSFVDRSIDRRLESQHAPASVASFD